ncbi:hypothetical protein Sj15T_01590 [Sphingobium sp. TA15]|uniref:Uncharacterized protein n=1 Tax=Sphingobium indicum (strain DSM 16413 / CCM 7287 / MTCC 6362 / UT26 / NBRC 101211 / UT26S) TaxID=452662 RepID=D4YZN8_SPHIU|nr:hypothetical protein [Sphingobium indicum]BAI95820.1 hypothetical protein SJA_C1-09860 [Sphingobium indicum UT26S]BDD65138.1 hypothetical protein Sj15T_01590 [Sphingobium sp. TA15]
MQSAPAPALHSIFVAVAILLLSGCGMMGCEKYASNYSCGYVENKADYEVWYWKNVADDNEEDNVPIGHAVGLRMCRENALAHAEAIRDEFTERSYICVLMDDGRRMEKHRLL